MTHHRPTRLLASALALALTWSTDVCAQRTTPPAGEETYRESLKDFFYGRNFSLGVRSRFVCDSSYLRTAAVIWPSPGTDGGAAPPPSLIVVLGGGRRPLIHRPVLLGPRAAGTLAALKAPDPAVEPSVHVEDASSPENAAIFAPLGEVVSALAAMETFDGARLRSCDRFALTASVDVDALPTASASWALAGWSTSGEGLLASSSPGGGAPRVCWLVASDRAASDPDRRDLAALASLTPEERGSTSIVALGDRGVAAVGSGKLTLWLGAPWSTLVGARLVAPADADGFHRTPVEPLLRIARAAPDLIPSGSLSDEQLAVRLAWSDRDEIVRRPRDPAPGRQPTSRQDPLLRLIAPKP